MDMQKINRQELHKMSQTDIKNIDPDNVHEVGDIEIDTSLPVKERIRSLLEQVENPYVYKDSGMIVKISFADQGRSLQSCMEEYLSMEMIAG